MAEVNGRYHKYGAEASVLAGKLELPLKQETYPQAFLKLHEEGGYLSHKHCGYRLESVLSFDSAYTQVAGNRETKPGHGWSTLVTSVVEKFNILDVVTADRIVAQIATEYPLAGYVPSITFLGTRFENLRIAGHHVDLDLNLDLFGEKPENDASYTQDPGFVERVCKQHERVREHRNPLTELLERYNRVPASFENVEDDRESVECSLVNQAEGSYPGRTFGHVIHVPHFGTIYLATVRLEQSDYIQGSRTPRCTSLHLEMIRAKLGCAIGGSTTGPQAVVRGTTHP